MRFMRLAELLVSLDMLLTTDVRLLRSEVVLVNRLECRAAVAAHVSVVGRRPHGIDCAKLHLAGRAVSCRRLRRGSGCTQVRLHLSKQPSSVPFAAEVIGLHGCVALRSSHTGTQHALQPSGAATTWLPPGELLLVPTCVFVILLPFFVVDVVQGSVGTQKAAQATTAAPPQHTRHTRRVFFLCASPLAVAPLCKCTSEVMPAAAACLGRQERVARRA